MYKDNINNYSTCELHL